MSRQREESAKVDRSGVYDRGSGETKSFLRGSSLLLVGRVISVATNFLVQVIAVRYLGKSDYGALAWALAIAALGASTVLLGLNRGVARFATIYHENRDYGAMFGTIGIALGTVAGLGLTVVVMTLGLQGLIEQQVDNEVGVGLLLILIVLVPIDALDALFETMLSVFARARAIFFRRHILGPGLKLVAVLLVVAVQGSIETLAKAYVVAGGIGIGLYATLLWQLFARQGLFSQTRHHGLIMPVRNLFKFSLPLLTTDLVLAAETPIMVVILEHFRGMEDVADVRVAAQVAALSLVVYQNTKLLFRSNSARFYARSDAVGLSDLYWRSAAWVTVITFPIFAFSVFLAKPLIVFMFGENYAAAAVLLVILAIGKYFNGAMGMNVNVLQVYARVQIIMIVNTGMAVVALIMCLALIPAFGAVGAAIATSSAIVLRNILYQIGLIAKTPVGFIPPAVRRVYASVLIGVAILSILWMAQGNVVVLTTSIVVGTLLLVRANRDFLDVADTFPELTRVPILRRLLSLKTN